MMASHGGGLATVAGFDERRRNGRGRRAPCGRRGLDARRRRRRTERDLQSAAVGAIGEVAAGLAHDLNNRLSVILGYTQLLRRGAEADSVASRKLQKIEAETLRASQMTRGLLDFSRRTQPPPEPVSINTIVPRALGQTRSRLQGRAITVRTNLTGPAPVILGDADQLTQVLINLVDNAIEAMGESGMLTVTTTASDDGVELSVADTGVGMDPEQASRSFEPFYTTKPQGAGAGLGLFLTLGILKRHGGTIAVESVPGCGTTMRVRLPRWFVGEPAPPVIG